MSQLQQCLGAFGENHAIGSPHAVVGHLIHPFGIYRHRSMSFVSLISLYDVDFCAVVPI